MKRIIQALILLFPLAGAVYPAGDYGIVQTADGRRFEGVISTHSGFIEWRRDIYEAHNALGETEKFILKPESRGKLDMEDVLEIRRIRNIVPGLHPEQYATLADGSRARLLLQYLILLRSGKSFYISDFITLEHYYLDVQDNDGTKRIYLSQIKSLKYTHRPAVRRQEGESGRTVIKKEGTEKAGSGSPVPRERGAEPNGRAFREKRLENGKPLEPLILILVFAVLLILVPLLLHRKKRRGGKPRRAVRRAHKSGKK